MCSIERMFYALLSGRRAVATLAAGFGVPDLSAVADRSEHGRQALEPAHDGPNSFPGGQ
jgi:hypothetical protein